MTLGVGTQMNLAIIFTFCLKILVWWCLQLYLGRECGGWGVAVEAAVGGVSADIVFALVWGAFV